MIYDILTDTRFSTVAAEVTWFQISSVQFDIYAHIPKELASKVFLFPFELPLIWLEYLKHYLFFQHGPAAFVAILI